MKNLKSLLLTLGLSVVALGLHANDNAGVAASSSKTGAGDLATTPALAPVAPVSAPVVAKPAITAPAVAPKAEAPVATASAAEEAPATTAGTATVAKKAEKKAGFFKRVATKMKRIAMSTFLLVGLILFVGGLFIAVAASSLVGTLLMLAGLVFIVLHFIQ